MNHLGGIFAGLGLLFSTSVFAQPVPVEAFAEMPTFRGLKISPDGQKFFSRVFIDGEYKFMVIDIAEGGVKPLFTDSITRERDINRAEWARDDRIVLGLLYTGMRYGTDVAETRLIGMNPDGSKQRELFNKGAVDRAGNPVQIQDDIVSLLPDDPGRILVQYSEEVYSVNIDRKASHIRVRREWENIWRWQGAPDGTIYAGRGLDTTSGDPKPTLILLTDSNDWEERNHRVQKDEFFSVIGRSTTPNAYYVISSHEGRSGVWEYDAKSDQFLRAVYADPAVDVVSAYYDSDSREVWGVRLSEGENDIEWLAGNWVSSELEKLDATFTGSDVEIWGFNETDTHALVHVSPPHAPGQLFIYDIQAPGLTALPAQQPALAGVEFGKVISTSYAARDGLEIPAYVTLPPGMESLEDARNLPFVLYPHGGPHARDYAGFDFIAQMLATRGYGVLQMNFRGSSGLGNEFLEAGRKQWGQAMQDDISDGAAWLVEQGYAAQDRMAILGASYGGYAALTGVAKTPNLYQCAVGLNGVYDLPKIVQSERRFIGGEYFTRFIGDLYKDRAMLEENSPINLISNISVPVLLLHGQKDLTVDVTQTRNMAAELEKAGKSVKYVELPDDDHYLSFYDTRLTFLKETEQFLASCLQ